MAPERSFSWRSPSKTSTCWSSTSRPESSSTPQASTRAARSRTAYSRWAQRGATRTGQGSSTGSTATRRACWSSRDPTRRMRGSPPRFASVGSSAATSRSSAAAPRSRTGRIEAPIGRDRRDRTRHSLDTDTPRDAVTWFEVREQLGGRALLDLRLETGRTHQIRVHLQAIELPVCGDPVYGIPGDLGLERQFLHAHRLRVHAPVHRRARRRRVSAAGDLAAALERARRLGQSLTARYACCRLRLQITTRNPAIASRTGVPAVVRVRSPVPSAPAGERTVHQPKGTPTWQSSP